MGLIDLKGVISESLAFVYQPLAEGETQKTLWAEMQGGVLYANQRRVSRRHV